MYKPLLGSSKKPLPGCIPQKVEKEAAVLLAMLGDGDDRQILLTLRSIQLKTHSGEVALPGGMREPADDHLQMTALREANEEVGLPACAVHVIAQMQPRYTHQSIRVTPFVGEIVNDVELVPCQRELESLFWVPMPWLLSDPRKRTDVFNFQGQEYWSPVYQFERYKIWGFTARLLVDFMNEFCGVNINRKHAVEEVVYR